MRKTLLIIVLFLFTQVLVKAQFDEIIKKAVAPDLLEEKNITTSIDDAYPVAFWLNDLDNRISAVEPSNYNSELNPGYYKMVVQSYCLKAGTHAPTRGNGHLVAPILGKRDEIVKNILARSVDHPNIEQHDVQVLLWSIIYGAKFTDLEPGLQLRVRPLLSEMEIADLSLGIKDIPLDILPDDIKKIAQFYKDLRSTLTNPASTYEDIERMAVIPGDPPSDLLKKQVNPGNWAYIGEGYFMRIIPEGYRKSVLELYRPSSMNVARDDKQRITQLEKDGYKVEVSYQDESDVMHVDGKYYPIYRFKTIKYSGPNTGEEYLVENTGWMIRGEGKPVNNPTGTFKNFPQDPSLSEYKARLNAVNDFIKQLKKYKKNSNNTGMGSEKDLTEEFNADKHFNDGMEAATNPSDLKSKGEWINKNIEHTTNWWNCAIAVLGGGSCNDNPKKPNPQKHVGAPGNTGAQRIAPSLRKWGE